MKKIFLSAFLSALLSTALYLCVVGLLGLQMAFASPYTDIDVATAYDMITSGSYPDLVVLDVRTKSEYDSGHIYGAVWIPVLELEARITELAGHENHETIVYCGSGVRSVNASETLDSHNFTKVYNMLGGILAWQGAGYPVRIATVHNVNTTFNYDTIQAAIDAPKTLDGHTILVDAGTYSEHVTISKSISLIGENRSTTIIDGDGTGTVVHVTANNTVVRGFTIQNSGSEWGGIFLYNSFNCSVFDNNVNNNYAGIVLFFSSNNVLRNNTMVGNSYNFYVLGEFLQNYIHDIDASNTADGKPVYYLVNQNSLTVNLSTYPNAGYVALVNSTRITVEDLTLTNNGQGVLLAYTTSSTIKNITASNDGYGIMLYYSSNCSLSGNNANNNYDGIGSYYSPDCSISGNNATHNDEYGVQLGYSSNCSVSGNNAKNNWIGIELDDSSSNTISGNNASNNWCGIALDYSNNNVVFHNNFVNNTQQVDVYPSGYANFWDDGYPSGGNYWSNYNETDADNDGIGDASYEIDVDNIDHFPLMGMFSDFSVTYQEETYHATTICNSTISEFQFNDTAKTISFNVTGPDYTLGFCRATIPNIIVQDLWKGNYTVLVDGEEPIMMNNWTDGTYTYIYFTYLHSEHRVTIIPEFPTLTSMLLILVVLTVAISIYKRLPKTPIH